MSEYNENNVVVLTYLDNEKRTYDEEANTITQPLFFVTINIQPDVNTTTYHFSYARYAVSAKPEKGMEIDSNSITDNEEIDYSIMSEVSNQMAKDFSTPDSSVEVSSYPVVKVDDHGIQYELFDNVIRNSHHAKYLVERMIDYFEQNNHYPEDTKPLVEWAHSVKDGNPIKGGFISLIENQ